MNVDDAIRTLEGLGGLVLTLGSQAPEVNDEAGFLRVLHSIEEQFQGTDSFRLEYELANAWSQFTFRFVRGDARKPHLERVLDHLVRSYELAKNAEYSSSGPHDRFGLLRPHLCIAGEIGTILVREAPVRDLDCAMRYLTELYNETTTYEPALCWYAEAFYKLGDYNRAAQLAVELQVRAKRDPQWASSPPPPATFDLEAKAYRAEGKKLKKEGRLSEAAIVFQRLIDSGLASESDRRLMEMCSQGRTP